MDMPKREDCIHAAVCKYDDGMCATECGHFEAVSNPSRCNCYQGPGDEDVEGLQDGEGKPLSRDDFILAIGIIKNKYLAESEHGAVQFGAIEMYKRIFCNNPFLDRES
jgi:hypothetical protein